VRGKCGLASATNTRAGSAPQRRSSPTVAPACSERLKRPLGSARATLVAITRGREALRDPLETSEVCRYEADVVPRRAECALDRAEEAGEQANTGRVNSRWGFVRCAANTVSSRQSSRSPSASRNAAGMPGPSGSARVSTGRTLGGRFGGAANLQGSLRRRRARAAGLAAGSCGIPAASDTPCPARTRAIQRRRSPRPRTPCAAPRRAPLGPPATISRR